MEVYFQAGTGSGGQVVDPTGGDELGYFRSRFWMKILVCGG